MKDGFAILLWIMLGVLFAPAVFFLLMIAAQGPAISIIALVLLIASFKK